MKQFSHKPIYILPTAIAAAIMTGCTAETPMVSLGIEESYLIPRMSKLPLESAFTGSEYRWTLHCDNLADSIISTCRNAIFIAADEGEYHLSLDVIDSDTPYHHDFTVNVYHEEVEYSPYISRVHEYCPAPGQFINEMPKYEEGDTYADILQKAEDCISGTNDIMISLGGYGGYVTFAFDHTVVNLPGHDIRIWGNCFYELTNPDRRGGSAEPGIVMASYDTNCNGLPDDPWYELAGSEYHNPTTLHGYSITYHRPTAASGDIAWTDSQGVAGSIPRNSFHTQDYFPKWIEEENLTFTGTLLPPNGEDTSGNGTYYILYSYPWGYADNHPNDYADLNSFDISWAVDADGNHVQLPGIDFIRVYTGVNQVCGWLGETSTEIARAQDLHIETTIPTK